jgi:hypothetical protein
MTMNSMLKATSLTVGLLATMCVADTLQAPFRFGFVGEAQAIIGVAPGGSIARRHAIVATEATVAATTASASAAASANASAQATATANANAQAAAKAAPPAPAPSGPPPVGTTVTTLPPGCVADVLNGVEYQRCGSAYYKPAMMGSNLVFVVSQP